MPVWKSVNYIAPSDTADGEELMAPTAFKRAEAEGSRLAPVATVPQRMSPDADVVLRVPTEVDD